MKPPQLPYHHHSPIKKKRYASAHCRAERGGVALTPPPATRAE